MAEGQKAGQDQQRRHSRKVAEAKSERRGAETKGVGAGGLGATPFLRLTLITHLANSAVTVLGEGGRRSSWDRGQGAENRDMGRERKREGRKRAQSKRLKGREKKTREKLRKETERQ